MPQINDSRATRLQLSGFDTQSDWLKDATGYQIGDPQQTNDLMDTYLKQRGFGPAVSDGWYDYLESLGHEGTISDKWASFWADPAPLPGPLP